MTTRTSNWTLTDIGRHNKAAVCWKYCKKYSIILRHFTSTRTCTDGEECPVSAINWRDVHVDRHGQLSPVIRHTYITHTRSTQREISYDKHALCCCHSVPSVLWRCWLGGRNGIRPVKNWVVRYWHGYLSEVRCKWFAYGLANATATTSSLAPVKSSMVYLSGADLPRLSWKKATKWI